MSDRTCAWKGAAGKKALQAHMKNPRLGRGVSFSFSETKISHNKPPRQGPRVDSARDLGVHGRFQRLSGIFPAGADYTLPKVDRRRHARGMLASVSMAVSLRMLSGVR